MPNNYQIPNVSNAYVTLDLALKYKKNWSKSNMSRKVYCSKVEVPNPWPAFFVCKEYKRTHRL